MIKTKELKALRDEYREMKRLHKTLIASNKREFHPDGRWTKHRRSISAVEDEILKIERCVLRIVLR
jgi:hypothetical protein